MKIRHPGLIKTIGLAGSWVIRLWMGTVSYRHYSLGQNVDPRRKDLKERYIYACWHENLLLPAYQFGRPDIRILISQHADGQLIAEICRHLRFRPIRGSTTRGGVAAVRRMLRASRYSHLGITPDGPRGPRRQVQAGLIYLAARTGLAIVPVGIGLQRPWRAHSWDRFALPRPWSQGICVTAPPIHVPADAGKEQIEHYRLFVQQQMLEVTESAEQRAERKAS